VQLSPDFYGTSRWFRRYHIWALPRERGHGPSIPSHRRALILEDEVVIAMDLEQAMYELGFETSELAATPSRAFSLAMSSKPDIALVDVCLEGGREGIEAARWLREVCDVPVVFVNA
jgi:CheY-like chemotaxis protein